MVKTTKKKIDEPIDKCYPKVLKRAKKHKGTIDKYVHHRAKVTERNRDIIKNKIDNENIENNLTHHDFDDFDKKFEDWLKAKVEPKKKVGFFKWFGQLLEQLKP